MRVWAAANQKGGVGKTTTAVSLAGLLSREGKTVLLVDMDPHGSMTAYFKYDPDSHTPSIYHLFQTPATPLHAIIRDTEVDGVKLLPASTALATLDRQLGAQEGKGLVLQRALAPYFDEFDYCIIDCPPLLGILMVNALAAASQLLVPVQTEFLAMKGLERMLHTLDMVLRARKQPLDYLIVPTMFDRRTRAAIDCLRQLQLQYGDKLWSNVIPVDTQFREASRKGLPISHVAASGRGAKAYEALLADLNKRQGAPASLHLVGHG
ncbi:MAG: AAA family ATPase [Gammaproteobacteria bacterium]|nr:AAA family ATPase [Gammaproteobacteria bacterium]